MTKKTETLNERLYKTPIKKRLTKQELIELDEELNTFREITPPSEQFPKETKTINQIKWQISRGARDEKGAIIITNYKPATYTSNGQSIKSADCDPILAEQLEQDFEQWNYWEWGKQIRERKQTEAYEKMA